MLTFMKDLCSFVTRLIAWLPILWKDRDWDHAFLIDLIQFKVGRMRAHHIAQPRYGAAHWSHKVREMDEFRHLVELYREDADDEWNAHYYRYHNDLKCSNLKECKKVLALSARRERRNWANMWRYLERHSEGWWD